MDTPMLSDNFPPPSAIRSTEVTTDHNPGRPARPLICVVVDTLHLNIIQKTVLTNVWHRLRQILFYWQWQKCLHYVRSHQRIIVHFVNIVTSELVLLCMLHASEIRFDVGPK